MIHLDYRDARPIYSQIVDNIRGQITAGVLEAGDKLPSVRELASQLAINPNTIQRAYRELEMARWIATVPGKGCFVCGTPAEAIQAKEETFAEFDAAVASLLARGITAEALIRRLEGGNRNA